MAQESPSHLAYSQALNAIQKIRSEYALTKNRSVDEISQMINGALSKFLNTVGKSTIEFEPIIKSEVPLSSKMNRFWDGMQTDINILLDQVDLLNASTVFSHNFLKTEILKAQNENSRLQNKIKTLELYSTISDNSLVFLGDTFNTEDFIDWSFVDPVEQATFLGKGHFGLALKEQQSAIDSNTSITILQDSNGFSGNNQELEDITTAPVDPVTNQKHFTFKSETNPVANISKVIDDEPNTWFEYEKYLVDGSDRSGAKNFNFAYSIVDTSGQTSTNLVQVPSSDSIDWANGPENGVLKLYLEIDLGSNQNVNQIDLLPFGLTDNANNPIHIIKVATSLDRTFWTTLGPENVWIANTLDRKISNINSDMIKINSSVWTTDGSLIRYIQVQIEQPQPITCDIGHLYYVSKDAPIINTPNYNVTPPAVTNNSETYNTAIPYDNFLVYGGPGATNSLIDSGYGDYIVANSAQQNISIPQQVAVPDAEYRVLGPNPPLTNPQLYMSGNGISNDIIQKRERFQGKRWAIGLRDISIRKNIYQDTGIIVSKRFEVPGIIDRVALEADLSVPSSYDLSKNWILFYVSPNNGLTWYQISRIQDDLQDVPEIIAFNDPTPIELREAGVAYYDVPGTVNSIRFKAEIRRPSDTQTSTPILKSYKLKIIKRS